MYNSQVNEEISDNDKSLNKNKDLRYNINNDNKVKSEVNDETKRWFILDDL